MEKIYRQQVSLLLGVLPEVAKEKCFALHGGTAINLFVRDMPRLSVDIDKWGGPDSITFAKLMSWTERTEPGIKYYSGKATYKKRLIYPWTGITISCKSGYI